MAAAPRSRFPTRNILENAFDGVVVMDAQGRVVMWNPRATTMFGWSAEEAIGRLVAELIIPEQFREQHENGLAAFLKSGEGPVINRVVELTAQRKDGTTLP